MVGSLGLSPAEKQSNGAGGWVDGWMCSERRNAALAEDAVGGCVLLLLLSVRGERRIGTRHRCLQLLPPSPIKCLYLSTLLLAVTARLSFRQEKTPDKLRYRSTSRQSKKLNQPRIPTYLLNKKTNQPTNHQTIKDPDRAQKKNASEKKRQRNAVGHVRPFLHRYCPFYGGITPFYFFLFLFL